MITVPSKKAGVYRVAGAILTGAGNATIGIGGTVEGIAAEAWNHTESLVGCCFIRVQGRESLDSLVTLAPIPSSGEPFTVH